LKTNLFFFKATHFCTLPSREQAIRSIRELSETLKLIDHLRVSRYPVTPVTARRPDVP
jgi:hypothetical protein